MKRAVLVVSFGSSYKETREKTIKPCEELIASAFEGYDFYRAFTSNIIIRKIARVENIKINNPIEVLDELVAAGYEEVVVQTLLVICGEEYCKLKGQVECYKNQFKKIVLGRPLLTQIEDYKATVEAVKTELPTLKEGEGVVLMGHGTEYEAHSAYCALDYMFDQEELPVYMGTVEGYPEIREIINRLRKAGVRKAYLIPFMLVAGGHAINDMAGDEEDSWKSILEAEGFEVECILRGLGENPNIRKCFLAHAQAAEKAITIYTGDEEKNSYFSTILINKDKNTK